MATSGSSTVASLDAFVDIVGGRLWRDRLATLGREASGGPRLGQALLQRHAIEAAIERQRRPSTRPPTEAERRLAVLAADAVALHQDLPPDGRARLRVALQQALTGAHTLVPLFHLLRTAAMQRARGFDVVFAGFAEAAPFDLLLARGCTEAEIVCDVVSAEDGHGVHRGAWVRLMDRIDPDLQTWLAAHPGRYLLKLTLPQGLRTDVTDQDQLAVLHQRIRAMLAASRRADHDEAAVLRLDPLMLAAAQADELGLMSSLRREFGHEAHLAVTAAGGGVFVLAARSAQENDVAVAIRRRMAAIAPARFSGTRPGILAMFIEDTDRMEWRHLREKLELEGEARQFLTLPEARSVVAVTCASRQELFGATDGEPDGELRFRNPGHPAAKAPALAPAVMSSL
ncbi:conserved protein of unknown function [Rhodovastum atsumiense]|uniref:Uncharacterized protein n=1 Tax=Rhodovastum atsumiense TaxID=504468 RepID=A0A5M6IRQ3_9PROT|nr:hypothetical protein [Rhodovastum atsumiense]KAA5610973.1 hypothetical protein F1189_16310 [Rhodovastum atsumiense]CAH2600249.1 conserved protein of unknown function [Rhodovastum atsumiense]